MPDDLTQTQEQDSEAWRRARDVSLQHQVPPTSVPGYDIQHCLGQGAYGEVWVGTDRNNRGRHVAIKFYTRRGGEWALLAREVEKLNFLATDRYVVQLIDIGWNATPPYYVMEYMEKGSLAERLALGPLPVKEALVMFREIALGVVSAHNRGVLHCDLKPANILLGLDGKPRLADFGQSRLSSEQAPALGTLFYMAPEQADLKATPDARWDVYALGALLYCLLTGAPPHRDAPGVETLEEPGGLEERLARYRRLLEQAPRPRQHRRRPGVDRALAEIIEKCLAVNPAKRYPNVQAVLSALDARGVRRARRPLLVLGALGPILLLLVMGGLVAHELTTAVDESSSALTEETRLSNKFAAEAVAEKVASKIDRRWRTLQQASDDPKLHVALRNVRNKKMGSPELHAAQQEVQNWLDKAREQHPEFPNEAWAVFGRGGALWARSPRNPEREKKYIGKNYSYRDFFNGERNLEPGETAPPLEKARRSNVFESTITDTRKVAFSVPIWHVNPKDPPDTQPHCIGVLIMTVDVGDFAELASGDDAEKSKSYLATLVDLRPDENGRTGAILQHPQLAEMRKKVPGTNRQEIPERELRFFLDPNPFNDDSRWDPNFTDPIGAKHPDYQGRWLASAAPVQIEERPGDRDVGWMVVVQEKYDLAIGPVQALKSTMLRDGWIGLGVALTVLTGLWLFVVVVLNESTHSRLFSFLKRRAGVSGDSLSLARASVSGSSPNLPPVRPSAQTLAEPPKDQGS